MISQSRQPRARSAAVFTVQQLSCRQRCAILMSAALLLLLPLLVSSAYNVVTSRTYYASLCVYVTEGNVCIMYVAETECLNQGSAAGASDGCRAYFSSPISEVGIG